MKAAIIKKYRLIIKTMGYVGWALFWLLLWDVAVTVDFMLFLTTKINLPLIGAYQVANALVSAGLASSDGASCTALTSPSLPVESWMIPSWPASTAD